MADEDDATETFGDDEYADYGDQEEEEYEVEEVADDTPTHILDRVFLGSIDAARNAAALARANVGVSFALLGADDERVAGEGDLVQRELVGIEDSLEEQLFERLPALVELMQTALADADARKCNLLVHCMAGRSRSPSLVAAWMVATRKFTLDAAVDHIQMARPWITINARFQSDLELFARVVRYDASATSADSSWKASLVSRRKRLPRLDFGSTLVADILAGKKTVTMRLASDVQNDANSDLQRIFPHTTVVATSASTQEALKRDAFAFLQIDRVSDGVRLEQLDADTIQRTDCVSVNEVWSVLKTFYPDITMQTPLRVLHFKCVGGID